MGFWLKNRLEQGGQDVEGLANDPEGTFWQKWIGGGVAAPIICTSLALGCWISGNAILAGKGAIGLPLEGDVLP